MSCLHLFSVNLKDPKYSRSITALTMHINERSATAFPALYKTCSLTQLNFSICLKSMWAEDKRTKSGPVLVNVVKQTPASLLLCSTPFLVTSPPPILSSLKAPFDVQHQEQTQAKTMDSVIMVCQCSSSVVTNVPLPGGNADNGTNCVCE